MTLGQERYQKRLDYEKEKANNELTENAGIIEAFQRYFASKGIILTKENFSYIPRIGIVAAYSNMVEYLTEELKQDKDGLYDFIQLSTLYNQHAFPGYISREGGNFMLMAHPHFRRSYDEQACYAPSFIDLFWKLKLPNTKCLIALDPNRVRINMDNRMYMEFDKWMGASFKRDIVSISNDIVQLRPPQDIDDMTVFMLFANTCMLDIKWATAWSAEDNQFVKSFYAEEFKTIDESIAIDKIDYFPAKYIHAEFLMSNGYFKHFDGATHLYTYDEYTERLKADLNYNAKNSFQIKAKSIKLFRLDGIIDVDTWVKFTCHFFTGDPLIHEYFEGKMPEEVQEILTVIKNNKNSEL